jgi:alkanesulfonate monooxygenase SsuD/methylene tetrahydromethanopterin reductase-like flavin-dependent oxidoreductase (luciferase family)
VHDTVNIETTGIPMVFVASSEFVEAADAQARALGADPARVFVPHPIQDRTDEELRALADAALPAIVAAVTNIRG